jgi:hypothetical protein
VGIVSLALQIGAVLFGELMSGRAVYDRNVRPQEPVEPALEMVELEEEIEDEPEDDADLADLPEPGAEGEAVHIADPGPPVDQPVFVPATPPRPAPVADRHRATAAAALEVSNLSADIAIGRARIVLLAGVADARDAAVVADILVSGALQSGLSVCRVDAGSGRVSAAPGVSDLCADQVGFGDVVHKVRDGLAEVPWGQLAVIDRRSTKAVTLLEALADIYEAVIVTTGRLGLGSSLPVFAGTAGRLVMVRRAGTPNSLLEGVAADAAGLGFELTQAVTVPEAQSEVA